jgi:hypothetical protein
MCQGELPDSQAHQRHTQRNPSEKSHRNDGFQAYGGIRLFFHVVLLILDHARLQVSEIVGSIVGELS